MTLNLSEHKTPIPTANPNAWLQDFLKRLYLDGVRSAPVRQLLLACAHGYHPTNLRDLNTFANQCDHEAARSVAPRVLADRVPMVVDACPLSPPSKSPSPMDVLAGAANTAPPAAPLVGIETNPGPFRDALRALAFPVHGRYGGPGYSAGKFTRPGEHIDWTVAPLDAQDEAYRRHDYNYGRMDKDQADRILARDLSRLGPRDLGLPLHPRNAAVAKLAQAAFTLLPGAGPAPHPSYPWVEQRHGAVRTGPPRAAPRAATSATMAVEPNPGPKGARRALGPTPTMRPRAGPKARGAPASLRQTTNSATFVRRELMFSGQVSGTAPPGTVLYSAAINPSGLNVNGSASLVSLFLNYEAPKWENFDIQVKFVVKPTGATTIAGTFTHGIDADVTDTLPAGSIAAVQRLEGQGGQTATWAQGGVTGYNRLNSSKFVNRYWVQPGSATTADARQCAKGKYWLITNEPTTSYFSSGSGLGVNVNFQVFAEYVVRFSNATLEVTNALVNGNGGFSMVDAKETITSTTPFGTPPNWAENTGSAPLGLLGTILSFDTSGMYLVFPAGTQWDIVNYAHVYGAYTATSGGTGVTATPANATVSVLSNIGQAAADCDWVGTIGLSSTVSYTAFNTCYKRVPGGWQLLLGTQTVAHYGYVLFSTGGSATGSGARFVVSPLNIYVPTAIDRMFMAAGPGTTEYKHVATWQYDCPLEQHLAACKRGSDAKEHDLHRMLERQHELEAELRAFRGADDDDEKYGAAVQGLGLGGEPRLRTHTSQLESRGQTRAAGEKKSALTHWDEESDHSPDSPAHAVAAVSGQPRLRLGIPPDPSPVSVARAKK